MPILIPSKPFSKQASKLIKGDTSYRLKINKNLNFLKTNPNHPSLRLHKLSGKNLYSVSVDKSIRIIFSIRGQYFYLLQIGTHDQVY